jgi:hypothetical protein
MLDKLTCSEQGEIFGQIFNKINKINCCTIKFKHGVTAIG